MKRAIGVLAAVVFLLAQASALAHEGSHKKVQGKITKVEFGMLHVEVKGGKDVTVPLNSETKYMLGKTAGSATDAQPGMRVVVHLTPDGSAAEEVHLPAPKTSKK